MRLILFRAEVNRDALVHGFKTAFAGILAVLITRLVNLPLDPWIVVTTMVVMCAQLYVGSVFEKSLYRFFGTIIGCFFASISITLFIRTDFVAALTVGLSGFIFAYFSITKEKFSYAATLGAVTTSIIMINNNPTYYTAIERGLEISIGVLIATVVSQFILPIHARDHLKRQQVQTLKLLSEYYQLLLINAADQKEPKILQLNYKELDENIVKSITKQRQLAKDSLREQWGVYHPDQFIQFLYCEKEMLRSITFMHITLFQLNKTASHFLMHHPAINAHWKKLNQDVIQQIENIITMIQGGNCAHDTIKLLSIAPLKDCFLAESQCLSIDGRIMCDSFIFTTDMFIENLNALTMLYHSVAGEIK